MFPLKGHSGNMVGTFFVAFCSYSRKVLGYCKEKTVGTWWEHGKSLGAVG